MHIRLLLANDHTLLREALRAVFRGDEEVKVVAEAADGSEALAMVALHRPDVALLDVSIPKIDSLIVATCLSRSYPETRVVVLSVHVDDAFLAQATRAGVAGYLPRNANATDLGLAVRSVARGQAFPNAWCGPGGPGGQHDPRPCGDTTPPLRLTPRQREVLRLIAEGASTKSIARLLEISTKTVETHRALLMERLGIYDVASLVRYAIRTGLVESEA
jgi:DNA-binding NarL/FixJ family response regulator